MFLNAHTLSEIKMTEGGHTFEESRAAVGWLVIFNF